MVVINHAMDQSTDTYIVSISYVKRYEGIKYISNIVLSYSALVDGYSMTGDIINMYLLSVTYLFLSLAITEGTFFYLTIHTFSIKWVRSHAYTSILQ